MDPLTSLTPTQRRLIERALLSESFDERFAALDDLEAILNDEEGWASLARRLLAEDENEPYLQLGLDMLGMLATRDGRWTSELVRHANRLSTSTDEDTRWSAAHAVSGLEQEDVLETLLSLAEDSDSDVRWQVALGLPKVLSKYRDRRGINALLKLMNDSDPEIRDWSAFGVGSQIGIDSSEIREALASHIYDEGKDTAGEAILGLARRGDDRAFEPIRQRLTDGNPGNLIVEAAGQLGDPRLLPALRALKETGWTDDIKPGVLDEAIRSCSSNG